MRGLLILLLCYMATVVAGDQLPDMIEVRALQHGSQCGQQIAAVEWIADYPAYPVSHSALRVRLAEGANDSFDSDRYQLVLVSMGQKPSAGYSLALADNLAQVEAGVPSLRLEWHQPPPDVMTAQVVTQPCLLLGLPKRRYQGVNIYNEQDELVLFLDEANTADSP